MGDHRASIKVEFSMYGETEKADMWINWSVNNGECFEVDQRVVDFFRDAYLKMRDKYDDHILNLEGSPPKREWAGLTGNEARKFYEKYTDREKLIHAIDKFLEEKNT